MFLYRVMIDMQLSIALPMVLELDNSGAVDIFNNWSSTGSTRHMDVRYKFLRELKESNILHIFWYVDEENESYIFTKKCPGPLSAKHLAKCMGFDKYSSLSHGEDV